MDIDKLALISGDPIPICNGITLYQPSLRQIKEYGEANFFSTYWTLCSSPLDIPSTLADIGIDFTEITNWELFRGMIVNYSVDQTRIFFGDIDFSQFFLLEQLNEDNSEETVLCNSDGVIITEKDYQLLIKYIQTTIGFQHSGKRPRSMAAKKAILQDDKSRRERDKDKPFESIIFDGIITLVNTEEFKYDYSTVMDITLYQYMKSYTQIQGKKAACALTQGSYSGFVDTSNIDKLDLQWVYSEEKYKPRAKKLVNNITK